MVYSNSVGRLKMISVFSEDQISYFDILFFDNRFLILNKRLVKCCTMCLIIKHNNAICKRNECEEILQHALEIY